MCHNYMQASCLWLIFSNVQFLTLDRSAVLPHKKDTRTSSSPPSTWFTYFYHKTSPIHVFYVLIASWWQKSTDTNPRLYPSTYSLIMGERTRHIINIFMWNLCYVLSYIYEITVSTLNIKKSTQCNFYLI